MKNNSTQKFYDDLSNDYHLIFNNWNDSIAKQAQALDTVIKKYSQKESKTLLDCSCGIGTQVLGLSQLGYKSHGSDLSPEAIKRAELEARNRNLEIAFYIADFTKLEAQVPNTFDVIISCDNSLPHLLSLDQLSLAAKNIFAKTAPGGLFIASIRDYDKILQERPLSLAPTVKVSDSIKTISFQVWDWQEDIYTTNHFTLKGRDDSYETFLRSAKYKAYTRENFGKVFENSGFKNITWLMPEESEYYQPILVASKELTTNDSL